MALPTYIPISDAARKYGYKVAELREMAESGKIEAVRLPDGDVIVSEAIKPNVRKEDLPEYKMHKNLAGVRISISEASRVHNIPTSTLTRWMQRGYIRRIGKEGRKTILDAQDVAYCAEIYRKHGGQGKWLFTPSGTPYQPKSEELLPQAV
ncbi:MAG: hypothetical protein HN413_17035 [Chloroflexi bacterium]|jgi:hypothetical protein|nr:hypothetical protein [Chloroflexota bacterium]